MGKGSIFSEEGEGEGEREEGEDGNAEEGSSGLSCDRLAPLPKLKLGLATIRGDDGGIERFLKRGMISRAQLRSIIYVRKVRQNKGKNHKKQRWSYMISDNRGLDILFSCRHARLAVWRKAKQKDFLPEQ